jgi:poly(3-hydroxyalkanoate) synthetase
MKVWHGSYMRVDDTPSMDIALLSNPLLEKLMLDQNMNEKEVLDIFYTSKTFAQLSDKSTALYLKSWQEIYEMLKVELRK